MILFKLSYDNISLIKMHFLLEMMLNYGNVHSNDSIFLEFAELLSRYKDSIINSFVMVEKIGPGGLYTSRLSNGPIESLNRKIKDLKRMGRGFRSFEHFRNRFLYATRNNPTLDGTSDSSQVLYLEDDDF